MHSTAPTTTPDAAYLRLFVNPTSARFQIERARASSMSRRKMMDTTSTTPTRTGALVRPTVPYYVARAITVAAALAVAGEAYLGVLPLGDRWGFAFADLDGTLREKAKAVWRRAGSPVQPRDLMFVYFDLRADLARAKAARERRPGTTRQEA